MFEDDERDDTSSDEYTDGSESSDDSDDNYVPGSNSRQTGNEANIVEREIDGDFECVVLIHSWVSAKRDPAV